MPEHEGFGYAYEASKQLVNAAFEEFGFQEIKAITAKENYASQKLLKRLGFEFEGLTNFFNDTEEYLFRIKRSAWLFRVLKTFISILELVLDKRNRFSSSFCRYSH